ncbi:unnamed protein product [Spirodela intermedia]|uniref:DUF1995 domain-containing protein n=1 Tax=Spirodela intermedia TaxID=51605 RepID=A0A7I8IMF0_SPIIN|nr:unnamed protein product [Spirodela intermedia]CAA6658315.1 unnamed protein product [Spirodela intermedia]
MASNVFRPLPVQVSLENLALHGHCLPSSPLRQLRPLSSALGNPPFFWGLRPVENPGARAFFLVLCWAITAGEQRGGRSPGQDLPLHHPPEAPQQHRSLPSKKLKRQKQPKFRVEIPVADGSPDSLAQLAFEVFSELPIKRKGARPAILMVWPDAETAERGRRAFAASDESRGPAFENLALGNVSSGDWSSADMGVFVASEAAMVERVRSLSDCLYPKPVVLFNPNWGFEEENSFDPATGHLLGPSRCKRNAVVFRCVKDGIFSGEAWTVLVEDETNKGELKVVTRFRKRPSMAEVENVLYNLMAANSPVTKSVKFLKDLVSNVTGGRGGK